MFEIQHVYNLHSAQKVRLRLTSPLFHFPKHDDNLSVNGTQNSLLSRRQAYIGYLY